jgi:predicted Rossmann fold flavoprotein
MDDGKTIYDVAVIGGGPAGMMAAGRAAHAGKKVIILEKNESLGRKLLLTGQGRCNLTCAEFNIRKLVETYGKNRDFLYQPFSVFGVDKTIDFFESRGLKTKIERGKRVFPASDKAKDVLDVLISYLNENKVEIILGSKVLGFKTEGKKISRLVLDKGGVFAKNYILCTGGKAFPGTGSTGDGYIFAKQLGHSIDEIGPALVPIKIKEDYGKELQGLSLKNIEVNVFQKGKKIFGQFGECLFAHFGLSGPIILDMSKRVGQLLKQGEVFLSLDMKPALDANTLEKRLERDFLKYQKKLFKNSLDDLLPQKMIPLVIKLSGISPDKKVNSITKKERQTIVRLLKGIKMEVLGLLGFGEAIITTGGVSLKEIDSKTMKSKLIDNLYFAGEILDADGPTGGYNLQVCWSTGYLSGQSAAG